MTDHGNDALDRLENAGDLQESVHDLIIHGRAICIRGVNYHFGRARAGRRSCSKTGSTSAGARS